MFGPMNMFIAFAISVNPVSGVVTEKRISDYTETLHACAETGRRAVAANPSYDYFDCKVRGYFDVSGIWQEGKAAPGPYKLVFYTTEDDGIVTPVHTVKSFETYQACRAAESASWNNYDESDAFPVSETACEQMGFEIAAQKKISRR